MTVLTIYLLTFGVVLSIMISSMLSPDTSD